MLHEFLAQNRSELIDRCKAKAVLRPARESLDGSLRHGIPQFLDQLIETLRAETAGDTAQIRKISGLSGDANHALSEIGESATLRGRELLLQGFTIDQVVHDYGDLCQAVTELAFERNAGISIEEFHTLNRCLDNAIADAVTEYTYTHAALAANVERVAIERQGCFVHELRGLLHSAILAFDLVNKGKVAPGGAIGAVVKRSLAGLESLIERSVIDIRASAGMPARARLLSLSEFIEDVGSAALLEANARECVLTVTEVDPTLAIRGDRDLLFSALANLLSNAFKFTFHRTEVTLSAYASADRILIDVSDNCGGLPFSDTERMFATFSQGSADRSGLGLGLAIARRSVEANDGTLNVRDVPPTGCVFTIDLPRLR